MSARPENVPAGTRAPGYPRAPNHRVAFIPSSKRVEIKIDDKAIVTSQDVVAMEEAKYPRRYYVARADVPSELLVRIEGKTTFCPFKGLAAYFSVVGPNGEVSEAAWSYEEPYLEAELLRDRICFDRDKVQEIASE